MIQIKKRPVKVLNFHRALVLLGAGVYLPRLRVVTSKTTAATSTAPRTMYCNELSMPIRFMPLVSEVMTSAPMMEPSTLPTPPAADTPPM